MRTLTRFATAVVAFILLVLGLPILHLIGAMPGLYAVAFVVGLLVLLGAATVVIHTDRMARYDEGLAQLDEQIHVDRHCVMYGHTFRKMQTPTRWRCTYCYEITESQPGWVDGGAA